MWIKKIEFEEMKKHIEQLKSLCDDCKKQLLEYEDESGEALLHRLTRLAKLAKIDTHSDEYQTMMNRVFMDIGGRQSSVLKGYSATAFMKDNPEEILKRVKTWQKQASIITKEIEHQNKK